MSRGQERARRPGVARLGAPASAPARPPGRTQADRRAVQPEPALPARGPRRAPARDRLAERIPAQALRPETELALARPEARTRALGPVPGPGRPGTRPLRPAQTRANN